MAPAPSIFSTHHLDFYTRACVALVLLANFLVVLLFKFLVLRWSLRMCPLKPICVLIMVDELEKLMATALLSTLIMFNIVESKSIIVVLGWSECLVRFLALYWSLAIFYGGLAIASVRLIYIKGKTSLFNQSKREQW